MAGGVTHPHQDHLGSPVVAIEASSAVIWRASRTPAGEKIRARLVEKLT